MTTHVRASPPAVLEHDVRRDSFLPCGRTAHVPTPFRRISNAMYSSPYNITQKEANVGLKHEVNKFADNVKDTINETGHRSDAEAEHAKRDVAGDTMTPGEKIGSAVNQAKSTVQADVDATKRDVRNNT